MCIISGICWRWQVGCVDRDRDNVWLKVQALPCSLAHIRAHAELRQDHTRGVIVSKQLVGYHAFSNLPGPVPTFLSSDPELTKRELVDQPRMAFECMQSLVAKLLATDQMTRY